jgi:site-specific DNA-methyltransferase (adenine-specific)
MTWTIYQGDCLEVIKQQNINQVDLIYLDPPFGTQKEHQLGTRDGKMQFSYSDVWSSKNAYIQFIQARVALFREILKPTGSLFFHCDSTFSHVIRQMLDEVFGQANFRSEIIWYYKRWTNSQKNLIPAHQTIFFYSKSDDFKFNTIHTAYSETTNVEQILHKRERDERGKSVYATDVDGDFIVNGAKKGVALNDVWEIPYLNPKAKERVGYPTQKPVTLLERIINLASDPGDSVLDPFCGSGTTLVAASLTDRNSIGIDISEAACTLARTRLQEPMKTESQVMVLGREKYLPKDTDVFKHLSGLEYVVVARNKGIDAILKEELNERLVFVRVQREAESLSETVAAILKSTEKKGDCYKLVIQTTATKAMFDETAKPSDLIIIPSLLQTFNQVVSQNFKQATAPTDKLRKMPAPTPTTSQPTPKPAKKPSATPEVTLFTLF